METPSVLISNDKDLQAGQKVGEYVIEAKIGEGGFGSVFRAAHPLIGKMAAIKVLNRQYSADPEMVSRFVAEARAVNQIRHRNIIDIFAFGQIEDGRSYYVMEFLDGEPLDAHIDHHGAMPLGDAIPILRAVARALDAAHAKGIAHRDLKPENIFLARESDDTVFPKLLDFGIAKLLGNTSGTAMHKTRTGAPIGTPYYMSPEQCRGRDVDHRTDIYAFGVVAYKLVTGIVPFDGEDYMEILLKQIGEEPVPPSQRQPGLPRAVDDAIAWMMKKDPAARPPNLITAMRALEEAAQAAGVEFVTDQPTGLHPSQTSRGAAQRTPSAITPLPRGQGSGMTPGKGASPSWISAATVDAGQLSDAMNAARSAEVAAATAAATPAPGDLAPPRSKAGMRIGLALVGAIAVGAAVFMVVKSNKADDATPGDGHPAAGDVSASTKEPAPRPEPTLPPVDPSKAGALPGTGVDGAAPPTPKFVTITVAGAPEGTEVIGPGGRTVGYAPGELQLDRDTGEIVLTFKADDYVPATRKLKPDSDQTIDVTLEKKKDEAAVKTSGGKKSGGRDGKKGGETSDGAKRDGAKRDGGKTDDGKTGRDTLEDPFGTKK